MITADDVKKIAKLAYLYITEDEVPKLQKELNSILEYVEQLNKVDVKNVAPMSHVLGATNVFREDQIEAPMPVEEALQNAPDRSGRFIRVPIIIDQGEH